MTDSPEYLPIMFIRWKLSQYFIAELIASFFPSTTVEWNKLNSKIW